MSALKTTWSMVGRTLIVDERGKQVVSPAYDIGSRDWHDTKDRWEELAPVLAAAPELLEALQGVLGMAIQYLEIIEMKKASNDRDIIKARAAIAKAGVRHEMHPHRSGLLRNHRMVG